MSEPFIIELRTPTFTVEEMENIHRELRKRIAIAMGVNIDLLDDEYKYNSI